MSRKSYPRSVRLGTLILEEVAQWLHINWDHPLHEEITVTRVELSPDQQFADVWVILHTDDPERVSLLLRELDRIIPYLSSFLGKSLHIRRVPRLRFRYDYPFVRGSVVESILFREMQERRTARDKLEDSHS